jgi:Putative restriction endonuclease
MPSCSLRSPRSLTPGAVCADRSGRSGGSASRCQIERFTRWSPTSHSCRSSGCSLPKDELRYPLVAPELVVEILSPDDEPKDIEAKRKEYFAWGVILELTADPEARFVDVYDNAGNYERVDGSVETYAPTMVPDLRLPLRAMFAKLDIPE